MPLLSDLHYEKFVVMCLSMNHKLLHYEFVSSGGVTGTVVDPKIIFNIALQHLSSNIIVAHNHPSGNLNPSNADKKITEKLKNGGDFLDVKLADHIIIGGNKYFSFADSGLL